MSRLSKTALRKCSITGMHFPHEFFRKDSSRPDGLSTNSLLGNLWFAISQRTVNGRYARNGRENGHNNAYHRKGVRLYAPWVNDPTAFVWYILTELGYPRFRNGEKLSIDRIDNDGDYEPGNLRWATAYQQITNRAA